VLCLFRQALLVPVGPGARDAHMAEPCGEEREVDQQEHESWLHGDLLSIWKGI
jgi:hypothetical protein